MHRIPRHALSLVPLALLAIVLGGCIRTIQGPSGAVIQETWRGIPGDAVTDLTGSDSFLLAPDDLRLLADFSYASMGNSYGARCTGWVVPPVAGEYTFWVAADDGAELWIEQEGKLVRIAWVDGYTSPDTFDAQPTQRSTPIALAAGKAVKIVTLHKQGGGGNHLSVAWQVPGRGRQPLVASDMAPAQPSALQLTRLRATAVADQKRAKLLRKAEKYWTSGTTMPVSFTRKFTVSSEAPLKDDTGINILLDQAHQTQFAMLWGLRGQIRNQGFRICSSVASLDSVLTPGELSRIRIKAGSMEPFAWWPTPEFNVVITSQQDLKAQPYTAEEQSALWQFVRNGGGLLVIGTSPKTPDQAKAWSLNTAVGQFGARFASQEELTDSTGQGVVHSRELALAAENKDLPVAYMATVGKGRVAVHHSRGDLTIGRNDDETTKERKLADLRRTLLWLAGGKAPVGGDYRMAHMGGVGIFPDQEQNLGSVVVYYAGNQKPEVLNCIEENIPAAAKQIRAWLPTKRFAEPYHIVICAGGGGGWAINGRPKAAAVISYSPLGILGIYAHEMAHTMGGPRNDLGELAGRSPHHNQGEAHAGWFQGKIQAQFSGKLDQANRNCNSILELETKKGRKLDLAKEHQTKEGRAFWGKGPEWTKLWYTWQKIEDRYGPTWYPRWYWVRSMRWRDEPGHQETWDEMVEDMSIAVGEDLFPFYRSVGTTLTRERLASIEFMGRTLELPIAPLDTGPAGNVCLDSIGDYTQPIKPKH